MKLKCITFTGIDDFTDLSRLKDIQQRHPYAEFGVLLSPGWYKNGMRFPNPTMILPKLRDLGVSLSAHLCGELGRKAITGDWEYVEDFLDGYSGLFSRFQINILSASMFREIRALKPFHGKEVIVQMQSASLMEKFAEDDLPEGISYLIDGSGGRGKETPIEPLSYPGIPVGYAGGITPLNARNKLLSLLSYPGDGEFWIDMETGIRTNTFFDLDKVENVLETYRSIFTSISD